MLYTLTMSNNPDAPDSQLSGDGNPTLFDFSTPLDEQELMKLYVTCSALEKACLWFPKRMMSAGWVFKEEGPFEGIKHGKPYSFPSFLDYIKWNGLYEELEKAMAWALLFRRSRIFFYLEDDEPVEAPPECDERVDYYGPIEPGVDICTSCEAMYALIGNNGWEIATTDENGDPEIYLISKTNKETKYKNKDASTHKYYVHASRCVAFHSFQKELGYEGTAKAQTVAHLSKLQKQMLQAVFVNCKNLIAGYIIYRSKNKATSKEINEYLAEFSHLTRLGWNGSEDLEDVLKVIVPDFNADQLAQINLLIQKALASAMNTSIRYLGEEDIAAGIGDGGAMISHEVPLFEIEDLQLHFQRPLEECFYMYGKEETSLVWNQPNQREEERKAAQKKDELQTEHDINTEPGMDNPNQKDVKNTNDR